MIFGAWSATGATPLALAVDTRYTARVTAPGDGWLAKLSVLLDGDGGGTDPQALRGVVYDSAGALLASSEEVTVLSGDPEGWVDFDIGPVELEADTDYSLGVQVGSGDCGRIYLSADASLTHYEAADVYADGPDAAYGAYAEVSGGLLIFATSMPPFEAPDVTDEDIAALPWARAEAVFGEALPPRPELRRALLTWHGTKVAPERGSVAIARTAGPFADWVGDRLYIAFGGRTVSVYCYAESTDLDPDEDLSLPRPIFGRLAALCSEPVHAVVGVLP